MKTVDKLIRRVEDIAITARRFGLCSSLDGALAVDKKVRQQIDRLRIAMITACKEPKGSKAK